jgi:hypothetical protein
MKLSIDENIQQITETMDKFSKELLKLEGSLQVFKQLKSMGIDEIDINNKAIIENTEVIDATENTNTGGLPPNCSIH